MGSPPSEEGRKDDEGPQHRVLLTKGFWLGVHPVAVIQWKAIMGDAIWPEKDPPNGDNGPVTDMSWLRVQEFCERLVQRRASVSDCRRKQSGNMHAGQEQQRPIASGSIQPSLRTHTPLSTNMLGIQTTLLEMSRNSTSGKKWPIIGAFVKCTATSGNGVKIGTGRIQKAHKKIPSALQRARSVYSVEVLLYHKVATADQPAAEGAGGKRSEDGRSWIGIGEIPVFLTGCRVCMCQD